MFRSKNARDTSRSASSDLNQYDIIIVTPNTAIDARMKIKDQRHLRSRPIIAKDVTKPPRLRRGYNALSNEERMRFSLGAAVCGEGDMVDGGQWTRVETMWRTKGVDGWDAGLVIRSRFRR